MHVSVPIGLAICATGLVGFAETRIRRTRSWLERVRSAASPEWEIVPVDGAALPELVATPPLKGMQASVLVHRPEPSATYRTPEERVLWAYVPPSGNDEPERGV